MATGKVVQLVNRLGRELGTAGLQPRNWHAADLIESRIGADPPELELQPALERLVDACQSEAGLTAVGRIAVHRHIVELLSNLARLRSAWTAEPDDTAGLIVRPVFITGLPRTGSTFLHGLLAQDPRVRVPLSWEVMRPPTGPGQETANRRYCEFRLKWARRLVPDFEHIHPLGATLPEECIAITAYAFRSIVFHTTANVPAFQDWLENTDQRCAYRFHRRFLAHLQRFSEPSRWVLKAPGHMFAIDALANVYPDAVIVQTHRDPVRVAGSLASHTTTLRAAFSKQIDRRAIARDWLARWWSALDRLLDHREAGKQRFVDVYYDDLTARPMETITSLYAELGWDLPAPVRDRMSACLLENRQATGSRHRYSLEQFGLRREAILRRLQRYLERYQPGAATWQG